MIGFGLTTALAFAVAWLFGGAFVARLRKLEEQIAQIERANRALELDAAEHKQGETALQEAEVRYRALVEQIPTIAYTDSAEQIGQTRYISVINRKLRPEPRVAVCHLSHPACWGYNIPRECDLAPLAPELNFC